MPEKEDYMRREDIRCKTNKKIGLLNNEQTDFLLNITIGNLVNVVLATAPFYVIIIFEK